MGKDARHINRVASWRDAEPRLIRVPSGRVRVGHCGTRPRLTAGSRSKGFRADSRCAAAHLPVVLVIGRKPLEILLDDVAVMRGILVAN